MFHLPYIPFGEIHKYMVEFAIVAATGISIYQFLRSKLHPPKLRSRRVRGREANRR